MAIDGMALALRSRERWPTTLLTQTHPKVLIPTLGGERYADASPEAAIAWFGKHSGLDASGDWMRLGTGCEMLREWLLATANSRKQTDCKRPATPWHRRRADGWRPLRARGDMVRQMHRVAFDTKDEGRRPSG
jgi:hypothetical protein